MDSDLCAGEQVGGWAHAHVCKGWRVWVRRGPYLHCLTRIVSTTLRAIEGHGRQLRAGRGRRAQLSEVAVGYGRRAEWPEVTVGDGRRAGPEAFAIGRQRGAVKQHERIFTHRGRPLCAGVHACIRACQACALWKVGAVESGRCGKCALWKVRAVESGRCGKWAQIPKREGHVHARKLAHTRTRMHARTCARTHARARVLWGFRSEARKPEDTTTRRGILAGTGRASTKGDTENTSQHFHKAAPESLARGSNRNAGGRGLGPSPHLLQAFLSSPHFSYCSPKLKCGHTKVITV